MVCIPALYLSLCCDGTPRHSTRTRAALRGPPMVMNAPASQAHVGGMPRTVQVWLPGPLAPDGEGNPLATVAHRARHVRLTIMSQTRPIPPDGEWPLSEALTPVSPAHLPMTANRRRQQPACYRAADTRLTPRRGPQTATRVLATALFAPIPRS